MVTLIGQNPNEFELHLRAILGLPIPAIELAGPSASAVILADRESHDFGFAGVAEALADGRARPAGRPSAVRQAQHAQEPSDGRGAGARTRTLSGRRSARSPRLRKVTIEYRD